MPIRRKIAAAVAAGALVLLPAAPALAYEPVNVVHTEHVQAGPYEVTVGFSEWPLRAMQSMDVSFIPDGGIGGKSGTLHVTGPTRLHPNLANSTLARHPRKLDVWGLDVIAWTDRASTPSNSGSTARKAWVRARPGLSRFCRNQDRRWR